MFKTARVGCYLHTFAGHGEDNENKELRLVFHVVPITPELAMEVSPYLADRLFRKMLDEWEPAKEISKAQFSSLAIQMQNITFHSLPDGAIPGVMVEGADISNVRAAKEITGNFRLEFDVVVPMDGITMRLVEQFYKSTCFLTMDPIQREIQYEEQDSTADLQGAADGESEPEPEKKKRGRKPKAEAVSA